MTRIETTHAKRRLVMAAAATQLVIAAIMAATLGGCAAASSGLVGRAAPFPGRPEPAELGSIGRVHLGDDIYLASQPSPEDIEAAQRTGVRTVINMRHERELGPFDEAAAVETQGLAYHNPAWNGPAEMTDDLIARHLDLLRTADRPILLHCGSANRVGAIWLVYRALDGGLPTGDAAAEASKVGLRTAEYERIARDYVARHR